MTSYQKLFSVTRLKNKKVWMILISVFAINASAQTSIRIGSQEEMVFPLDLNTGDLYHSLNGMRDFFSAKTIVGMGEATHGTKEFFETKAQVFKFLVTECNYRVFGMESSYGGCRYINDFVSGDKGTIDSVMLQFDFWTWRTQEVKELILWIRDYNATKRDQEKVAFYGFDMQNFYSPMQYFYDFFKRNEDSDIRHLQFLVKPVLNRTELQLYHALRKKESTYSDTLVAVYDSVRDWLRKNKDHIAKTYSVRQYERLNLCLDNFHQAIRNLTDNGPHYRDSCMAYNVAQIQKIENAKMFVWAHNGHVNLNYPEKISVFMGLPMGGYIRNYFGDDYYSIGFVFNEGSFQAIKGPDSITGAIFKYLFARRSLYKGLLECTVPVNKENTFTNHLSKTQQRAFFLDLNRTTNPVFVSGLKTYDIGAVYINKNRSSQEIYAKRQFNGMIYIQKTTRAIPITKK
jgi:erythromycin esterase